jgi:hypothetical protein
MRRPPLISYLTYNRLGNTAITLPSLLRTFDDFELYLIDNGSKDDTWQFLNDTKDPRIKHRKRFDDNIGCAHALNYGLSFRKEDQDWINYEYDFRIHDKNFVTHFWDVYEDFPEFGGFSATSFPEQTKMISTSIMNYPDKLIIRNGHRVYLDTIMGFCSFFPYETMNLIGYYDESLCALDIELNQRLNKCLGKKTGYVLDIHCSQALAGGYCPTCIAFHEPCIGNSTDDQNSVCMKFYSRVITKVYETVKQDVQGIIEKRISGELPIKCNSMYSSTPMSEKEKQESLQIIELYNKLSNEFTEIIK